MSDDDRGGLAPQDPKAYRKECAFDFRWPQARESDKRLKPSLFLTRVMREREWIDGSSKD